MLLTDVNTDEMYKTIIKVSWKFAICAKLKYTQRKKCYAENKIKITKNKNTQTKINVLKQIEDIGNNLKKKVKKIYEKN